MAWMKSSARVYRTTADLQPEDIRELYDRFNFPIAKLDCGKKCAPHNPSGKPFCCDICHAVPAAYKSEWKYLQRRTKLWHKWRGDESGSTTESERAELKNNTPPNMVLLACLGPTQCQRDFRALSCRQFPFFPYVTTDYRFIGMAYEWEYEDKCWVISNLSEVTPQYRNEFIQTYDRLFALFQSEFENYAYHSERLRAEFGRQHRRFPLLHRNGRCYVVNPENERMHRLKIRDMPKFGFYKK